MRVIHGLAAYDIWPHQIEFYKLKHGFLLTKVVLQNSSYLSWRCGSKKKTWSCRGYDLPQDFVIKVEDLSRRQKKSPNSYHTFTWRPVTPWEAPVLHPCFGTGDRRGEFFAPTWVRTQAASPTRGRATNRVQMWLTWVELNSLMDEHENPLPSLIVIGLLHGGALKIWVEALTRICL